MFDRNQWLEWAKNSQNNPEMKDSQFNVRKNDQTKGYLYEDSSDGRNANSSGDKGTDETSFALMSAKKAAQEKQINKFAKKIPSKIGRKVYSAGARAVTDPEIRNQAKTVATWKLADILVDKFSNRRKNDPDSPTRIIPNPVVDESNDLDEAAFLLPLLAPLLSMGSAVGGAAAAAGGALGTAAGGLAARAAGSAAAKGIAKFATAGAKRLATTGKRLITKPKRMGGGNLATQSGLAFAPTAEGQENLAVSSWRKSIQQLDEQQLDEFLGRLLKGAGRVFKRKPKITKVPTSVPVPPHLRTPTYGTSKIINTPTPKSTLGKLRDFAKFKKGYGAFGVQKLGRGVGEVGKNLIKPILKDPAGAAASAIKTGAGYYAMGSLMNLGGAAKDPKATEAQSTADAQTAASDRIDQQRIARKPSRPIPT